MHVLLCVENSYFKNKDNYISQEEWIKLWQKALKVNYKPVANIKAIKPNKKGDSDIQAAIKETSKYSVKSSDYLTGNKEKDTEIVSDLEQGLYRKRMLSYGGLLKKKHKKLNLDDVEEGNLIHTNEDEKITEEEKSLFNYCNLEFRKAKLILKKFTALATKLVLFILKSAIPLEMSGFAKSYIFKCMHIPLMLLQEN
ncbi:hypothetical protein HMPREF3110_10385 [Staphylococcus sp. HMSC10C03]|nr:hypothetical protein HMPREF3110_10385 [Staphylococcus sp. HMSC10C03]